MLNILDLLNLHCCVLLHPHLIMHLIEDICQLYVPQLVLVKTKIQHLIHRLSSAFIVHLTIQSIICICMPYRNLIVVFGIILCLRRNFVGMQHSKMLSIIYPHRKQNCDFSVYFVLYKYIYLNFVIFNPVSRKTLELQDRSFTVVFSLLRK